MHNTIILRKGTAMWTKNEMKRKFFEGCTVFGADAEPDEIERWSVELNGMKEAANELQKYKCSYYDRGDLCFIEEYALEICECDADGEFVCGSDYIFAEKE